MTAVIMGGAETGYTRHPKQGTTTESLLIEAAVAAVEDAGISLAAVDGLAMSSFSAKPDHAVDLAWKLGTRLSWLMEDTNGGASGGNMIQHAVRAIEAGDASVVLIVAGDRMTMADFTALATEYNAVTRDWLAPLGITGPNPLFAHVTKNHMEEHGLKREDYGNLVLAQRRWAGLNPGAVYRQPLTMADYLDAPVVAPPLGRYDCVPPVSGADAIVLAAADCVPGDRPVARVLATAGRVNADSQRGTGTTSTGLGEVACRVWDEAGRGPEDVDLAWVYDDYPVMVCVQLDEIGLVPGSDIGRFLREQVYDRDWPLNTSGGQLSAGQAGAAGGLHGFVEAAHQLQGRAGQRQVHARTAAVTGYGMVLYRYGAAANLTLLAA